MDTTTSRVLLLLELLQSAEIRSVPELADRLEVNERTVRRYVEHLLDLDIPIESVRGRYGGYRLSTGNRMPPLILNDEEAVAVAIGLIRAQSASGAPDVAAQIALAKIQRSLPATSVDRLGTLLRTAALSPSMLDDVPDAGILLTVADAIRERRPLELRYRDADGLPSRRTVHPYDLVVHSGRWYLSARDIGRQEERTFRIDRIRTARALSGAFTPPARRDALSRLVVGFAAADYPWRVILRIHATEERIRTHLPPPVAVVQRLDDLDGEPAVPWHRVEIRAKRLDWLPTVLAGLDCDVIIDEPDELREGLRATASRLLRMAEVADSTPPTVTGSPDGTGR